MNWPHDITGELPASRDDEPDNLRQNIADELADHLHCALNRELLLTGNEQQAKQNTLEKFGNPNQIARQLWFDWMKEKIMSQRILLATSIVMMITCLAVGGMSWMAIQNNQSVNAALLERINAIAAQKPASQTSSLEWNEVKIHLVKGKPGGPPAEGWSIMIDSTSERNSFHLDATSNSEGIVDCGMMPLGNGELHVLTPWDEVTSVFFTVRPGKPELVEVVCPETAPPEVDVSVNIDWPKEFQEEIKKSPIWVLCDFELVNRKIGNRTWDTGNGNTRHATVVVTETNKIFHVANTRGIAWRKETNLNTWNNNNESHIEVGAGSSEEYKFLNMKKSGLRPRADNVQLIETDYLLKGIEIVTPPGNQDDLINTPWTVLLKRSYREFGDLPRFSVKQGEKNHWTITIPKELLQQGETQARNETKPPQPQTPQPQR